MRGEVWLGGTSGMGGDWGDPGSEFLVAEIEMGGRGTGREGLVEKFDLRNLKGGKSRSKQGAPSKSLSKSMRAIREANEFAMPL